jgi:hypothetical protein
MKESRDGDALFRQFVVKLGRFARFQYAVLHTMLV